LFLYTGVRFVGAAPPKFRKPIREPWYEMEVMAMREEIARMGARIRIMSEVKEDMEMKLEKMERGD
jgi:hypothetical protein